MKHWDLDTSAAQLRDAVEELQTCWQHTSERWQDSVSQKFCEAYLEPLGPAVKRTLDASEHMQQILSQVYRDCES